MAVSYKDPIKWGTPTYSNEISTSGSNTISYKTIKIAYEYLASGAGADAYITPTKETLTFDGGKIFSYLEEVPFYIPEAKEPPVPVMPERLT